MDVATDEVVAERIIQLLHAHGPLDEDELFCPAALSPSADRGRNLPATASSSMLTCMGPQPCGLSADLLWVLLGL